MKEKNGTSKRFFSPMLAAVTGLLLLLCLIWGLLLQNRQGPCVAEIRVDGQTVKEIDLISAENQTISPKEGVVIAVENHEIYFVQSPCREQRCVRAGRLSRPGQSAFCLPQQVLILLRNADEDAPDAILG